MVVARVGMRMAVAMAVAVLVFMPVLMLMPSLVRVLIRILMHVSVVAVGAVAAGHARSIAPAVAGSGPRPARKGFAHAPSWSLRPAPAQATHAAAPGLRHTAAVKPEPILPADDPLRIELHNEVHARPPARIRLPALITYVAVLHDGVSRAEQLAHLRRLPEQQHLPPAALEGNFLRLRSAGLVLKWERHNEFSRYTLLQPLPPGRGLDAGAAEVLSPVVAQAAPDPAWLRAIPGRTVAAIELVMVDTTLDDPQALLAVARRWMGDVPALVASVMGQGEQERRGHSMVVTDFALRSDGFERMLVLAPSATSETRAGRIATRLLELETYRLMALRGLPVAKALAPLLLQSEAALSELTSRLVDRQASEPQLLDALVHLAATVERATAENAYRFSATAAYHQVVQDRIAELREQPIPGTQTVGAFMRRRLSPAIATVASTAQRLSALSERIARTGALLRTRVDIALETQNQQLLSKLSRGQELQLKLQSTVEGLSIAAISYYMISLLLYGLKAAKAAGLPVHPELVAGLAIAPVLWIVWRLIRRLHARLDTRLDTL
jgi:uncharacterized membrane-anchored protein